MVRWWDGKIRDRYWDGDSDWDWELKLELGSSWCGVWCGCELTSLCAQSSQSVSFFSTTTTFSSITFFLTPHFLLLGRPELSFGLTLTLNLPSVLALALALELGLGWAALILSVWLGKSAGLGLCYKFWIALEAPVLLLGDELLL